MRQTTKRDFRALALIIPIASIFALVLYACGQSGDVNLAATPPDNVLLLRQDDYEIKHAQFDDPDVMRIREKGFTCALVIEDDEQIFAPLFVYRRGKAGGGGPVTDLWPPIYSIGKNSSQLFLPKSSAKGGKFLLLLKPIEEYGEPRDRWRWVPIDRAIGPVVPLVEEMEFVSDRSDAEAIWDAIEAAESYRSKARSN